MVVQVLRRLCTLNAAAAVAGAAGHGSGSTPSHPSSMAKPVAMPPILYGTAWKKERTVELVLQALRAGFRGIDTACQPKHYDESGVGEALELSGVDRSTVYLQTKFTPLNGQDPARIPYDADAAVEVQVEQSVSVSLHNLRTSWIDCLVLHSPYATPAETLRAWRAMEHEVDRGRCRSLGVSNCYQLADFERLHREARVKPVVLQNRFYKDSGYDVALRQFCNEHGVTYQSFWTLTANPKALSSRPLRRVAKAHGCSEEAAWFGFVRGLGIVPLTGTSSEAHMAADLAAPELTHEEVRMLDEVLLHTN